MFGLLGGLSLLLPLMFKLEMIVVKKLDPEQLDKSADSRLCWLGGCVL
jgi:hypothetical protein